MFPNSLTIVKSLGLQGQKWTRKFGDMCEKVPNSCLHMEQRSKWSTVSLSTLHRTLVVGSLVHLAVTLSMISKSSFDILN